jgi:ankyrin repeat protein
MDSARFLLENGANADAEVIPHFSALAHACFNGRLDMAKLLLDNGANVHWKVPKGTTLFKMARGPHQKQIRELLKQHGVTE